MPMRVFALLYGLICHSLFAVAVGLMMWSLYHGMASGWGRLDGDAAVAGNFLLLVQFPLIHSFLLSQRGRALLARLIPGGCGKELSSTTYVIVACLQLILVFAAWSPSGTVWYRAEGSARLLLTLSFAGAWVLLLRSMYDAGLALQTGALGWTAVFAGRKPVYPVFCPLGLFRYCRQPIYASFALILWTGPVWTPDQLFIASAWTIYALAGPMFKEKRFERFHGESFREYQRQVPYWFPSFRLKR